ncbi:hypothetical protein [Blastomonas sp. UPD001]|uniref:hypothetical protein n=1 Tax=Blastomonas sp. UPD001 TaxID=2217673 RepID=UPI0013008181|nr:hypothetical protein [Blastomonas sp. UPD001]
MADGSDKRGGGDKSGDKGSAHSQKTELRDSFSIGKRPVSNQKVTSSLKPPTRPKDK